MPIAPNEYDEFEKLTRHLSQSKMKVILAESVESLSDFKHKWEQCYTTFPIYVIRPPWMPALIAEDVDGYMKQVTKTARSKGAIGRNPVCLRYILTLNRKHSTTLSYLDYGAGPEAIHTQHLLSLGFDCRAWDIGENFNPKIHKHDALFYCYDVVMASNVLNVQPDKKHFLKVLKELHMCVRKTGRVILNYPKEPRKMPQITERELRSLLGQWFEEVSAKPIGNSHTPVWVCTKPKEVSGG